MRTLLFAVLVGGVVVGCNAIFGIEVIDPLPAASGGMASSGGAGGQGGSGTGAGMSTGGSGVGGDACMNQTEICGDGKDQNCDGVPDDNCAVGAYVSDVIGKDHYPGTQEWPVKTIGRGILNADEAGLTVVTVAQGTYDEVVVLVDGIDVAGGHHCAAANDCSWELDTSAYTSIIDPSSIPAVRATAGVTRETTLSGFEIRGEVLTGQPGQSRYATVELIDASPLLTNNQILGPNVTCTSWCTVAGVTIEGDGAPNAAGPKLELNDIGGGVGSHGAYAVHADTPVEILDNTISGGTGLVTAGIHVLVGDGATAAARIEENKVSAGTCAGSGEKFTNGIMVGSTMGSIGTIVNGNAVNVLGSSGHCEDCDASYSCGGIWVFSGNHTVTNNMAAGVDNAPRTHGLLIRDEEGTTFGSIAVNSNTLLGGGTNASASSAAIRLVLTQGNTATAGRIRNNILDGGAAATSWGIREADIVGQSMVPELVENNQFQNAAVMWAHWDGNSVVTDDMDITAVNGNGNASANQAMSCPFGMVFHLLDGGDCENKGTSVEAPGFDIDGQARPIGPGYDLGADERE